ncbi:hypothetical protein [Elioraea rosea]|uniref:hypothetical protein n=1 Tax=Elioraea rosea TaxID=2492390 RepID=UPI0011845E73|nr:hypothetical protein [Elioraea rosea]
MNKLQGRLPRRGFLALGGAATWCAACAGTPSAELRRQALAASQPDREVDQRPDSASMLGTGQTSYVYRPITPYEGPLPAVEVHYALTGPHALPAALRAPPMSSQTESVVSEDLIRLAPYDRPAAPSPAAPSYVQYIARCAEYALWRFRALGFDKPALGRDGAAGDRLHIFLAETRGFRGVTSPEWDHIEISNRLIDLGALTTVGHEVFHRVQYAANATPRAARRGSDEEQLELWTLVYEGGARFAEDFLTDSYNRYGFDAERWFTARRRPLARSRGDDGGLSGASYEAALFWKYVSEQHGNPLEPPLELSRAPWWQTADGETGRRMRYWLPGPAAMREADNHRHVLAALKTLAKSQNEPKPLTMDVLRQAREKMRGLGTLDSAVPLDKPDAGAPAAQNGTTVLEETTWTNFLCGIALNGQSGEDSRFQFREQPAFRGAAALRVEVSGGRTLHYAALPSSEPGSAEANTVAEQVMLGRDRLDDRRTERVGDDVLRFLLRRPALPNLAPMLRPYDMAIYKVLMPEGNETRLLRVELDPGGPLTGRSAAGLRGGLVQVIMLGPGGHLVDIHRHDMSFDADGGRMRRTFACRGVSEVLLLVCSRENGGTYTVTLSRPERSPVLASTSWNCVPGKALTQDPAVAAWNWMSPDLDVVHDVTALGGRPVPGGGSRGPQQVVRLAIRNLGDRYGDSRFASVAFACRKWSAGPSATWTQLGEQRIGFLKSVEAYERDIRGGWASEGTRNLGKRFMTARLPDGLAFSEADPLMLRATIRTATANRNDQDVIVLGSSHPIGESRIDVYAERGVWTWRWLDPDKPQRLGPEPLPPAARGRLPLSINQRLLPLLQRIQQLEGVRR